MDGFLFMCVCVCMCHSTACGECLCIFYMSVPPSLSVVVSVTQCVFPFHASSRFNGLPLDGQNIQRLPSNPSSYISSSFSSPSLGRCLKNKSKGKLHTHTYIQTHPKSRVLTGVCTFTEMQTAIDYLAKPQEVSEPSIWSSIELY